MRTEKSKEKKECRIKGVRAKDVCLINHVQGGLI